MRAVNAEAKVREVALLWPESVKVFSRHNMDLCCGGELSLRVAAQKHNLDLDQLLRELNEAVEVRATVK
ncbi:MAG: DUF542 domain-containing protein [Terriglobia bacterium]